MNGIELSYSFYNEYGKKMTDEQFSDIKKYLAIGVAGSGSDCYGFDDEISRDHDYEPGFIIFIPGEDVIDRKTEFKLERAYEKLPKEYKGYRRSIANPVGGKRKGIIRISNFFLSKTNTADGILSVEQWLKLPTDYLFEAVNGEIFDDYYGEVTQIRNRLSFYPDNIALKKLAGYLLRAFQTGQYNYERCLMHGENGAAQVALFKFSESIMNIVFLLNEKYMPYYKWSFKAMKKLPVMGSLGDALEFLITTDNSDFILKKEIINDTSVMIADKIKSLGLSASVGTDLDKYAYDVNNKISDNFIRDLNIFEGI